MKKQTKHQTAKEKNGVDEQGLCSNEYTKTTAKKLPTRKMLLGGV